MNPDRQAFFFLNDEADELDTCFMLSYLQCYYEEHVQPEGGDGVASTPEAAGGLTDYFKRQLDAEIEKGLGDE